MKRIKLAVAASILAPVALWLLADSAMPDPFTYFAFRAVFVQLTGIVAIVALSAATILALRPRWIEPHLGGLERDSFILKHILSS